MGLPEIGKKGFSVPAPLPEGVLSPDGRGPARFAGDRLDSWKEIANHLGREVRTVQLWEKLEGLPVHRHFHRKLGSVFAYRSEVDAWRQGTSRVPGGNSPDLPDGLAAPDRGQKRVMIAVLPFESLGGHPEEKSFTGGLAMELITALASLAPQLLGVISRASVMAYQDSPKRAEKLSKELNVGHLLEGTAQVEMGRMRVNVALVDVRDKTTLWSKSYKSAFENSGQLQSRVAGQIAHHVGLKLLPPGAPGPSVLAMRRSTSKDAYFLGRYLWKQRTEEALQKAIRTFEAAIQEDPRFALAYSGLADCLTLQAFYEIVSPSEVMPAARQAALRAVELDPYSAEARTSLADIFFHFDRDWTRADQEYQAAIQCNPKYGLAYHWYANLLVAKGQHTAAHIAIQKALDLDPLSAITNAWCGVISHFARRYDEAITHYRRALELDPYFAWTHMFMAQTLEQTGQIAEALREFEITIQLSRGSHYARAMMAHAQAVSGGRSTALRMVSDLHGGSTQKHIPSYDIAAVYAALGDPRKTITWLDRACREHNMKVFTLAQDPRFDPVRKIPAFRHLIHQVGLNSTAAAPGWAAPGA